MFSQHISCVYFFPPSYCWNVGDARQDPCYSWWRGHLWLCFYWCRQTKLQVRNFNMMLYVLRPQHQELLRASLEARSSRRFDCHRQCIMGRQGRQADRSTRRQDQSHLRLERVHSRRSTSWDFYAACVGRSDPVLEETIPECSLRSSRWDRTCCCCRNAVH